jgi:hypothetical protein
MDREEGEVLLIVSVFALCVCVAVLSLALKLRGGALSLGPEVEKCLAKGEQRVRTDKLIKWFPLVPIPNQLDTLTRLGVEVV